MIALCQAPRAEINIRAGHGWKQPCQDQKLAAAASTGPGASHQVTSAAERGRSASLRPRDAIPDPVSRASVCHYACAPARWGASSGARQIERWRTGPGAVASATDLQPTCNQQAPEIIELSLPVARLHLQPRVTHAPTRVCAHAHMYTRQKLQPCNHDYISQGYQIVIGCSAVAERLRLQPAVRNAGEGDGKAREINIIGRGYAALAAAHASICPIRGQIGGRVAKTFRPGARAVGSSSSACTFGLVLGAQGENGAFLRVCGGEVGRVGTRLLERCAGSRRNQPLLESRRLLLRLTGASAWARSAVEGGRAPRAPRQIPRSFAPAIFLNLDPASRPCRHDRPAGQAGRRPVWNWPTGSGEAVIRPGAKCGAGWGGFAGLEVRRAGEPSGGGAHVN